jgi:chorismate-pyruvate lyase
MGLVSTANSDLTGLYSIFGDPLAQVPQARFVSAEEVPEPYRTLLAHDQHMTVTMEEFYNAPVNVVVLRSLREGKHYARKILLRNSRDGRVVQFGIMRFNFAWCSDEVRDKIIEGKIPLGRILIEHNVLRRISTHALMAIRPNAEIMKHFDMDPGNGAGEIVYGRLATIFCNEEPAVNLLEVAAPIRSH